MLHVQKYSAKILKVLKTFKELISETWKKCDGGEKFTTI